MTHGMLTATERARGGITDGLVRVSVGVEDVEDLLADFDQAIPRAAAARAGSGRPARSRRIRLRAPAARALLRRPARK